MSDSKSKNVTAVMGAGKTKKPLNALVITAVFNTLVAVVLSVMVLKDQSMIDIFILSQLIGLSICTCVLLAEQLIARYLPVSPASGGAIGLFWGLFSGSFLCWTYLSVVRQMAPKYFFNHVFSYVAVFGLIFGLPMIYYFFSQQQLMISRQEMQNEKIKRLTIEKEAATASLRLLQAQIEPHFLFNTLSNVLALFDTDVDKARLMLIGLNEFLRSCLQMSRCEMITLGQELEMTAHYLNIFKIRMGDRLSFQVNTAPGCNDLLFPPLIVQPLVENSIKYGLEPKPQGGIIIIDCRIIRSTLEIVIIDTGLGLEDNAFEAGTGIDNVSRRLEAVYGSMGSLTIENSPPQGTRATIRIPI